MTYSLHLSFEELREINKLKKDKKKLEFPAKKQSRSARQIIFGFLRRNKKKILSITLCLVIGSGIAYATDYPLSFPLEDSDSLIRDPEFQKLYDEFIRRLMNASLEFLQILFGPFGTPENVKALPAPSPAPLNFSVWLVLLAIGLIGYMWYSLETDPVLRRQFIYQPMSVDDFL